MGEGEQSPARDSESNSNREITRRAALVVGGATAGIVAVPGLARAAATAGPAPGSAALRLGVSASPSLAFQLIRVEDMLYLGFEFFNAKKVVKNGQTFIAAINTAQPVFMVVVFPSQHLGEECFANPTGDIEFPPNPPLHGALAGFSWLTFQVPSHASIPFTAAGLLHWTGLTPQLVPVVATGAGSPQQPDPLHSALEVPWSLWLSPPPNGTWHHSATPVTAGGRTELWHTRLGVGGAEPPAATPLIKAFWSSGYGDVLTPPPADPWLMSLGPTGPLVREDIVSLTCSVVSGGGPVRTSFLALSALGASINVAGDWNPGPNSGISLIQWIHRASIGRDSYVRVVFLGYLFPFGNRAVHVIITDREFHTDRAGATVAYLIQRQYVVVTEPVITFAGDTHEPDSGRGNPIRRIEVKTVSTPPLDFDAQSAVPGLSTDQAFWPRANGADIQFSFVATDTEGRTVDFTTPVIWVDSVNTDVKSLTDVKNAYDAAPADRNTPSFGGALLAFADTKNAKAGSTAHHVQTYTHTGLLAANGAANFYPALSVTKGAAVHLPGPEQLTGGSLSPPNVTISGNYIASGFVAGVAELYLSVASSAPSLGFPVSLVGGMAAPNFGVSGIARDLGPVGGDLTKLLSGNFDPAQYFSVLSGSVGKLLGAIPISEIIKVGTGLGLAPGARPQARPQTTPPTIGSQAPQITSNWEYPGNDDTKPPTALDTKLTWNPQLQPDPLGFFNPGANANLLITAQIHTPISNPAQTTYSVHGELADFTLKLFGGGAAEFIDIAFTSFTFDAKTGAKPSVKPQISGVTFSGPLSFIQDFEQLLASIGGPSIDVTAAGIDASYTLALPDVGLGVFSLSNVSLSGGVNIPFDGTPVRVRFALCSQDNPFLLTIWIFGGGGFFSLAIGADGIEQLQVSLEFGAAVSIDLGVASGGVSIMAGIYFSLQTFPSEIVMLTGFLRADGNLSVLGIISISMEFYLGLTYVNQGGKPSAYGEASVTVSISVLFFSTSVTATYQKTIAGGSDPDFAQAISQADWDVYCEAFA